MTERFNTLRRPVSALAAVIGLTMLTGCGEAGEGKWVVAVDCPDGSTVDITEVNKRSNGFSTIDIQCAGDGQVTAPESVELVKGGGVQINDGQDKELVEIAYSHDGTMLGLEEPTIRIGISDDDATIKTTFADYVSVGVLRNDP